MTLDSIHITRGVFGISSGGSVLFRNGSVFENHIGWGASASDSAAQIEIDSVRFIDNDLAVRSWTELWALISNCTFIDSDVAIETSAAGEASVVLDGCVLENSHLEFEPHGARPTVLNTQFIRSGIEVESGDGEIVVEGCTFEDVVGSPIDVRVGVHVRDSEFVTSPENAGQTQRTAIYGGRSSFERVLFDGVAQVEVDGDEVVLKDCKFRNIQERYAVELFDGLLTIEDCEFHGSGSESAIAATRGVASISRTRIDNYSGTCVLAGLAWIEDSIISNCGESAIEGGSQVINCTVANTGSSAVTSSIAQVRNSIFLNAPLDVYYASNNILWPVPDDPGDNGRSNRFLDPLLVDPAGGDFRLQAGSPAIDAGNSLFRGIGSETDAGGEPRIVDDPGTPNCPHRQSLCGHGEPIDAGAHEFQGDSGMQGFGRDAEPPPVVYVKADATGANDGSSWEDAYTTLSAALAANRRSADFWIAAGEYMPDPAAAVSPRYAALALSCEDEPEGCRIRLYGSFAGTESSIDQRDLSTLTTVLSGDIGVRGDDADNSLNVVSFNYGDFLVARMDGLVIRDGNGNKGSGAIVWFAQVHIDRCRFENNHASNGALAIVEARAAHVTNSEFVENNGCAFYSLGTAGITECEFHQNEGCALAFGTTLGFGRVLNSSFVENTGFYSIVSLSSMASIVEGCRFEDNIGTGGSSRPISADRAIVRNVVFARNEVATHRLHSDTNGDWRYSFPALSSIYLSSPPGEEDQLLCDGSDNTCAYPGSNPDRMVDPGGGDYRLLPNSRAIDSARPGRSAPHGPRGALWPRTSTDFDGAPRAVEHGAPRTGIPWYLKPFGGVIDRGAFEFQGVSIFGDDDGDGRADLGDFASMIPCLDGPAMDAEDPTRINGTCLDVFGGEGSRIDRIDLRSFAAFQRAFGGAPE